MHASRLVDTALNGESDRGQWRRMLVVHGVRSMCDRAWAYFLPLFLASVAFTHDGDGSGVVFAAGVYVARKAAGILCLPIAAMMWESTPLRAGAFLAAENASLVASAVLLRVLLRGASAESGAAPLPLLLVAGILMSVEASFSKTLWNAVEKEQTFVESRGDTYRLAAANAVLARIDLVVGAVSPFGVALLTSMLGVEHALLALVGLQLLSAIAVAPWLMLTFAGPDLDEEAALAMPGVATSSSDMSGVRFTVIAHALLHFTVVSPHGMLLVWLRERELAESRLSLFVSLAQICGAAGSWLPALALRCSGRRLEAAAARVQAAHAVAVVAAAVAVALGGVHVLLFATALSRAALWGSDLLSRQVVQVRAGTARMQAFAVQGALSQVASCAVAVLALYGTSFATLCGASAAAVVAATLILVFNAAAHRGRGSRDGGGKVKQL